MKPALNDERALMWMDDNVRNPQTKSAFSQITFYAFEI